jgi:hypothetical protein
MGNISKSRLLVFNITYLCHGEYIGRKRQYCGHGIGGYLCMDGNEHVVDYDYLREQWYGEWNGELFLYGQQYGINAIGNDHR